MKIKDFLYTIKKYVTCPWKIVLDFCHYKDFKYAYMVSDKLYLKCLFRDRTGKKLNLNNPQTFCEKLQWLKLYDRKEEYIKLVDKYEVKKYVAEKFGEQYVIPTLGCWNSFDEIDFDKLPDKFVLKCTHDSGGIVICKDKKTFDIEEARIKINNSLATDFFFSGREWVYKKISKRIIAESYMVDESGVELKDYKFFCFDGKVKAMFVATDRFEKETKFDFFDANFNHLPIKCGHPNSDKMPSKPACFDKMIELAEKMAKGFPHIRIDLYNINGNIYFGEYTFYHWSGMQMLEPFEWEEKFGSLIKLPLNRI